MIKWNLARDYDQLLKEEKEKLPSIVVRNRLAREVVRNFHENVVLAATAIAHGLLRTDSNSP